MGHRDIVDLNSTYYLGGRVIDIYFFVMIDDNINNNNNLRELILTPSKTDARFALLRVSESTSPQIPHSPSLGLSIFDPLLCLIV